MKTANSIHPIQADFIFILN